MHVFADLRPYICTFSDCKVELAQFSNRTTWADHEFSEHRYDQIWNCPECSERFASVLDWEQHLKEMHQRTFSGPQLHVARNTAYREHPRPVETEECPLCCEILRKPRRDFVKHVARHMEEIALMALPCDTVEDSDDSSIDTDQSSLVSETADSRAVDLPDSTKEESEKSSISTVKLGSENAELLAGETGTEAREEESHDQNDESSTDDVSNQSELISQKMEAVRLDQDSFVNAGSEAAHNQTLNHDQLVERPIKSRWWQRKSAAPPPQPPPPAPPAPPPQTPRFWKCGNCSGGRMSIRLDLFCVFCGRRKDYSAMEYS